MRKGFVLLLIMLAIPVFAQFYIVDETWEDGTLDPWVSYLTLGSYHWEVTTYRAYEGTYSVRADDHSSNECWLVFGPFDVPGDNLTLDFWEYSYYPTFYVEFNERIRYSTGSGNPADGDYVDFYLFPEASRTAEWSFQTHDLSGVLPSGTEDAYIAIYKYDTFDTDWFIDNIQLYCDAVIGYIAGNVTLSGEIDHSGATVDADGNTDVTDAAGDYVITLGAGTYDVNCSATGFYTETETDVVVTDAETTWVNFVLPERPIGTIVGHADLTDTPGADAAINIYIGFDEPTTTTAADGSFTLADVDAGTNLVLYAQYDGYSLACSAPFDLADGETVDVDTLFLDPQVITNDCSDFESDDGGLIPVPATGGWAWGTPTVSGEPTGGAHSPTDCWGTVLDADYGVDDADWSLTLDVAGALAPGEVALKVRFWHWYYTEGTFDGCVLKASTDGGTTFEDISPVDGYDAIPSSFGGYVMNADSIFGGTSVSWVQDSVILNPDITHFRFQFYSDFSISTYPGWFIDDVCLDIEDPSSYPKGDIEGWCYDVNTYLGVPSATVMDETGYLTYTDASGYFLFEDVVIGENDVEAHKVGYFPGYAYAAVNPYVPFTVWIPMHPVDYTPEGTVVADIAYDHEDQVAVITFCNPTNEDVDFTFDPYANGYVAGGPSREARPTDIASTAPDADPLAIDNRGNAVVETEMPAAREYAMGDVIESWEIPGGTGTPWGLGIQGTWSPDYCWISDIGVTGERRWNKKFTGDGTYTGEYFDVATLDPASSWGADMTWDGELIWQVVIGATSSKLIAWNPTTHAKVDSIMDPATTLWGTSSMRGIAYDFVEDVFYIGGWVTDIMYKIKGTSWDNPGEVLTSWGDAGGIAGIGFHHGRRTLWIGYNGASDVIVEVDPDDGTILNSLEVPPYSSYSIAGLEVDGDGTIWYVSMTDYRLYKLDSGYGILPGGIWFEPSSGTLAPGECVTIYVYSDGYTAEPGTHEITAALAVDPIVGPELINIEMNINPTLSRGWNIISVPVLPEPNDPWAQLHDDISPFDVSSTGGQLYAWDPIFGRFYAPEEFERGEGYYLYGWHNDQRFDVYGDAYDTDFNQPLDYYTSSANLGWHLIGNPFNRRVDWDAVAGDPGTFGINTTLWFYSQRFGWASYRPGVLAGGHTNQINPWEGFWVYVDNEDGGNVMWRESYRYESFAREAEAASSTTDFENFALRVSAFSRNGSDRRTDYWNYMATFDGALDGADDYDNPEMGMAPPGGLPLNASWVQGIDLLKDEFKAPFANNGESKSWYFRVSGLTSGTSVRLEWPAREITEEGDGSDVLMDIDEVYSFNVIHPTTGEVIDMRNTNEIEFIYDGPVTVEFTVYTATLDVEDHGTVPSEYAISQNYPNPFNSSTAFDVSLIEAGNLTIEVYSYDGEKVATIVDGEHKEAGNYTYRWNGKTDNNSVINSGVYFYKVSTENFTQTRKMMLIK